MLRYETVPLVGGFRDEVAERLRQFDFQSAVVNRFHRVNQCECAHARLNDTLWWVLPTLDGEYHVVYAERLAVVVFGEVFVEVEHISLVIVLDLP